MPLTKALQCTPKEFVAASLRPAMGYGELRREVCVSVEAAVELANAWAKEKGFKPCKMREAMYESVIEIDGAHAGWQHYKPDENISQPAL